MVYVISDLHGYPFEKVKKLFETAGFSDEDECFVLGDVIDRGRDGVKLLRWFMSMPNVEFVLGNHEAMMLACSFLFEEITEISLNDLKKEDLAAYEHWKRNGAEPTVRALSKLKKPQIRDLLDYLSDAPLYDVIEVNGKDFLLTHSGLGHFEKGKALSSYEPDDFLWNRPQLTDRYFDRATVVFGHTPTLYYGSEYRGEPIFGDGYINIDAGAASGIPPILLRLDDMKVFRAE